MFLAFVCFSLCLSSIFFFRTCFISFLGQRLNPAGSCPPTALFIFLTQDPPQKGGQGCPCTDLGFRSICSVSAAPEWNSPFHGGGIHIAQNPSFKGSHSVAFGTCTMWGHRCLYEVPQHFVTPPPQRKPRAHVGAVLCAGRG